MLSERKPYAETHIAEPYAESRIERWSWRNCRSIGFRLEFWPLDWALEARSEFDRFGGEAWVHLGPFGLTLCARGGGRSC